MRKILFTGVILLPFAIASCSTKQVEVRAMPLPESARSADATSMAMGRMLFERGEFALAADAFRKAVRADPDSADAYNGLAASYDNLGRFDLSRRYYELALSRAPEDGRILRNFARSMLGQGDKLAARKLLAEAAALGQGQASKVLKAGAAQQLAESAAPETQPFQSGQRAVTVALSDGPVAANFELLAAEPISPAPSLFHRIAATIVPTMRPEINEVNVKFDPPAVSKVVRPATAQSVAIPAETPVAGRASRLHIMNAVGRKRQAARMRAYLADNGWMGASTGDSRRRLIQSRILYPASGEASARRLAGSLPFKPRLQRVPGMPAMFLMLGRDSVPFDSQLRAAKQG